MKKRIIDLVNEQYKAPKGLLGVYFGEKMVRQHRIETLWTLELLKLQDNDYVLELGCGAGYAVKRVLRDSNVKKVVGFDLSQTALASARFRNRANIYNSRAKFVLGNVNSLPFQDGMYSKVYSIQSVYFWESIHDSINEIYRVLKPGGSLIITLSDGKNGIPWMNIRRML
ncbi:class I SAM-dependent methyltransferase [Rossellomorea aquimaris]|uniref:class I SAM-dependent methyltransferase n=1 Tax=Rossellomorea aquimaris TaxID=189382 RepID=UPI0011E8BCF5|nr:class I SAM-dependent methyltransferase [Rossellomorea aquimaris]TYS91436.1 class I SAM-dependent methyltransferase [Rossellomorea aquimaris]